MLRDNLVGLIEPMRISAGVDPLALSIQKQASDDRSSCLENPRPEGAESSLTENVTSPFQAEPAHVDDEAFNFSPANEHEVLGDQVYVPIFAEWRCRFQDRPGCAHVSAEVTLQRQSVKPYLLLLRQVGRGGRGR